MPKDLDPLNNGENLAAENEFMKMKLMLERGAKFSETGNMELPPEVENQFLKNILEFEKQFDECKTIKIFDKIARPLQFKPVTGIPDAEIKKAWEELSAYLQSYGVTLDVCSPNISQRELYRFTTEEMFELEIEDMNVPGMMQVFIYDEFHPDAVYENTRMATDQCINLLLRKNSLEWIYVYKEEGLRLNEHYPLSVQELKDRVNRFKMAYDDLEVKEINVIECVVETKESWVKGDYSVMATAGNENYMLSGKWKVILEPEEGMAYWHIKTIQVDGICF